MKLTEERKMRREIYASFNGCNCPPHDGHRCTKSAVRCQGRMKKIYARCQKAGIDVVDRTPEKIRCDAIGFTSRSSWKDRECNRIAVCIWRGPAGCNGRAIYARRCTEHAAAYRPSNGHIREELERGLLAGESGRLALAQRSAGG